VRAQRNNEQQLCRRSGVERAEDRHSAKLVHVLHSPAWSEMFGRSQSHMMMMNLQYYENWTKMKRYLSYNIVLDVKYTLAHAYARLAKIANNCHN